MRKISLFLFLYTYMNTFTALASATDERFDKWKEGFVLQMWKMYPAWASSVGYHKYDNVLIVPDEASRQEELAFVKAASGELREIPLGELSPANKTDYYLIQNQLSYAEFNVLYMKAHEWDPSVYNVSGGFAEMLTNDYGPLDERLRSFSEKLRKVPAYYAAAIANIKNPTAEHTALAIEQNTGGLSVFTTDLPEAIKKSGLAKPEKDSLKARADAAVAAITHYATWLKQMRNETPRSFRLGTQLYERKFRFELQTAQTPGIIFKKAMMRKRELHEKMYDLTKKLWTKHMGKANMPADSLKAIRMMIDELSKDHVKPSEFQAAIEKQLPELIDFIKKKDLIYIDPSKPLVVRREPAYMAGVAGASINAPGPYDKNGNTYYNVGSLEGWDKEKAESYLREYNKYILQILNIHEAIPGHYTQLVYANRSPSIIKAILGNNAMVEGWAVYTELMMLENGYDGGKGPGNTEASPEMWLMYYKWNLRSVCNTILDYSVHTKNMSKEDAMHLLMEEAFQQKAEAEGKWKRASVTQVQLCCYFTGFSEICELRDEQRQLKGAAFSLKQFHETFLSFGSAPVMYIKELMK